MGLVIAAAGCGPAKLEPEHSPALADSVTLRVFFKAWGSGPPTGECNSDVWGWDTLTTRLAAGGKPSVDGFAGFEVARVLSSDSALLIYPPRAISRVEGDGPGPIPLQAAELDTLVITPRPIKFCTNTVDGGSYYRVQTVPVWPEPKAKSLPVTKLFGKVTDGTSGRLVSNARVLVLGTGIGAYTDIAGRFFLENVPAGRVRLEVCNFCYLKTHLEVNAPTDSLVIPVARRPGCSFPAGPRF